MSARLSVEDLAFGYGERVVGAGVGFSVAAGEVLCLLGPNSVVSGSYTHLRAPETALDPDCRLVLEKETTR
ncbi:hypothetical protein GAY28_27310, partial [Azospirillum brasilense]|nr:hypothetical protein [Azospirillum brasilense]